MKFFFLRIYDYFENRRWLLWLIVGVTAVVCILLITRISIDEDIAAFLPLDKRQQRNMELYGQFSGSDRIVVIFEDTTGDRERIMDAIDSFALFYDQMRLNPKLNSQIDVMDYIKALTIMYENMPYFLTNDDYSRMDSILATSGYVDSLMRQNWRDLLMPLSPFAELRIKNDPLNLFTPVLERLKTQMPYGGAFSTCYGYILSEDGGMGLAWLETPYGSSETRQNAELVDSLNILCGKVKSRGVDVRLTGAPVIAVENARCIRHDSLIAGVIALLIIVVLLWTVLRNPWSILLIIITVGVGWLIAIAMVSAVFGRVSIIVIGMGSVLTGIAVNYPLHVVMHRNYVDNLRENLGELVTPLVIGNITTVAAFCALLPLEAVALRQLGVFAAALLVGTILFSVVVLPHILPQRRVESGVLLRVMPSLGLKSSIITTVIIVVLTVLLGLFIPATSFDTDLSNINYMTDVQCSDIARLSSMSSGRTEHHTLYLLQDNGCWDENCSKGEKVRDTIDSLAAVGVISDVQMANDFLPSRKTKAKRISRWNSFVEEHRQQIVDELNISERSCGFTDEAFAPFRYIMNRDFGISDSSAFFAFASVFMTDKVKPGVHCARCQVSVDDESRVIDLLRNECTVFTQEQNNAAIASTLSSEFDFIGIVCSCVVFLFLWLSFRRFGLALLAFIPMAVSWIWILGVMGIVGIEFNIVNIILATFIFGQGDDYTIFMVEGVVNERNGGQSLLPQYRTEIVLSAMIMLVGIGTLVISRHPAMHSLGSVTLIGMTVVVLMAYLLPQAIMNIYMKAKIKR